MKGPYYVTTDARRRAAWGPPCKPDLAPIIIDGKQYQCDRSVVPAFNRLEKIRAKWDFHQNGSDTGFYNCRRMRHDPDLAFSVHAWARALDWDWLQNPAGNKLITNMPKGMIRELQLVMTNSGVYVFMWGGDWDRNPATGHSYYDAMHWEVIAHPLDLATGIAGATPPQPLKEDTVILKSPARGNDIKVWQTALNEAIRLNGISLPPLSVDGIFGDVMKTAVSFYQTAAGIVGRVPELGALDDYTRDLLVEYTRVDA